MKKILQVSIILLSLSCYANENALPQFMQSVFNTSLNSEVSQAWDILLKEGVLEKSGPDQEMRPCFVTLQGVLEHVLASELQNGVKNLVGIIHTPMPTTPLCTTGEISKELVDPSIEKDPARLLTVKARTTILRDYLFKGGDLYIVYPKNGLSQRTPDQQKIYKQELLNHKEHLFDVPLNCESIPENLIGATYFFQDGSDHTFVFSIQMTQAKDPKACGNFGLWFGPIEHPLIQKRIHYIFNYLEKTEILPRLKSILRNS